MAMDAPTEEIAKCFCCDGADFDPDYFDGIAASCADYLSEERPDATDEYKGRPPVQSTSPISIRLSAAFFPPGPQQTWHHALKRRLS